jgi:hypothetical protein
MSFYIISFAVISRAANRESKVSGGAVCLAQIDMSAISLPDPYFVMQ